MASEQHRNHGISNTYSISPPVGPITHRRRLRAAFDLMAGYLALLRFDARAAFDGRLSTVLSCLCEALEFDEDFNVQVGRRGSSS